MLSTFVVIPMRWMVASGWRRHTEHEPHLDAYEREHFAYSPGGRDVSDATPALLNQLLPASDSCAAAPSTLALLDPPLRYAFRYPDPGPVTRALGVAGLRARAVVERRLPPRRRPRYVREMRQFAIYPHGYAVDQLGRSPRLCGPMDDRDPRGVTRLGGLIVNGSPGGRAAAARQPGGRRRLLALARLGNAAQYTGEVQVAWLPAGFAAAMLYLGDMRWVVRGRAWPT